jgi:hypothetical protein
MDGLYAQETHVPQPSFLCRPVRDAVPSDWPREQHRRRGLGYAG